MFEIYYHKIYSLTRFVSPETSSEEPANNISLNVALSGRNLQHRIVCDNIIQVFNNCKCILGGII